MSVTIRPFASDHLESAAALLAARHRRDRRWAPALSATYEDPAATLPVLQGLLDAADAHGVVALREGRIMAYLIGRLELVSPTDTYAGFAFSRGADIGYAGYAADPDDGTPLVPRLYAALAQGWVANGLIEHSISIPANPITGEPWLELGFGRFVALGVRSTSPLTEGVTRRELNIEIRRATIADEVAVQTLVTELFRTFADPPIFVPYLPETTAQRHRHIAELLADPACPAWLAIRNGCPLGIQVFEEPHSSHWHQSKLQSPSQALYLHLACTASEARGTGVGAALFARTMEWAREAGYASCMVHYFTSSRAASFWRGIGFHPISYWMKRVIDERAIWGRGEA
jgi:GNAT superfamily N-acetyltransferase